MRLPSKPNYGGVASLAKPSGRQEFAFAMQKSQQKTERTDAVLKIAQTAYKAHDDFSAQQSTSKHVSAMRDTDKYLMDNPFLDPDDIGKDIEFRTHDEIIHPNGDKEEVKREKIPSYEIALQLFEKNHKASVESNSETILSNRTKKEWIRAQNEMAEESKHKLYEKVRLAQQEEIRNLQVDQFDKHVADRDYDLAIGVIGTMDASDRYKRDAIATVHKKKETDTYNDVITEQNVHGIRSSLRKLENDDYNAKNDGENLNEDERRKWASLLRGELNKLTAKSDASGKAQLKLLKRDVEEMEQNLEAGIPVNANEMEALAERVRLGYSIDPDGMIIHVDRMRDMLNNYPTIVAYQTSSKEARAQHLVNERARGTDITVKEGQLQNQLVKIEAKLEARGSRDALSLASDVGLVDLNPMPNPLADDPEEREAFRSWLKERRLAFDTAEEHSGEAQGLMTDAESEYFITAMLTSSAEEQVYIMGSISQGLGTDAHLFWDQMYDKEGGIFSVAGSIHAAGDTYASRLIVEGLQTMGLDKDILAPKIDHRPKINKALGEAYPMELQRNAIVSAINATYVQMAKNAGDRSGNLDDEILKSAVDSVTGGIIRMRGSSSFSAFGGYRMPPPKRGMTGDDVDSYVRETKEEWWTDQGGVGGYVGEHTKLVRDLQNGAIQYISTGEPNEYRLYSTRIDAFLPNSATGEPFIFHIDDDAPKGTKMTHQEYLKSLEEGDGS